MRHELRDYIRDTVLAAKSFSSHYLCKGAVTRLLDAQIDGQGCSKEVFSLLVLELWHRQFIDASFHSIDPGPGSAADRVAADAWSGHSR